MFLPTMFQCVVWFSGWALPTAQVTQHGCVMISSLAVFARGERGRWLVEPALSYGELHPTSPLGLLYRCLDTLQFHISLCVLLLPDWVGGSCGI